LFAACLCRPQQLYVCVSTRTSGIFDETTGPTVGSTIPSGNSLNVVPQLELLLEEMALERLDRDTGLPGEEQYFPPVPDMVVHRPGEDNDIVQVDSARLPPEAQKRDIQGALDGRRGVDEAKLEPGKPEQARVGSERDLVTILDGHWDLPVPGIAIQGGEHRGIRQGVEAVVHPRDWVHVIDGSLVQGPEVNTNQKWPPGLGTTTTGNDYSASDGSMALSYSIFLNLFSISSRRCGRARYGAAYTGSASGVMIDDALPALNDAPPSHDDPHNDAFPAKDDAHPAHDEAHDDTSRAHDDAHDDAPRAHDDAPPAHDDALSAPDNAHPANYDAHDDAHDDAPLAHDDANDDARRAHDDAPPAHDNAPPAQDDAPSVLDDAHDDAHDDAPLAYDDVFPTHDDAHNDAPSAHDDARPTTNPPPRRRSARPRRQLPRPERSPTRPRRPSPPPLRRRSPRRRPRPASHFALSAAALAEARPCSISSVGIFSAWKTCSPAYKTVFGERKKTWTAPMATEHSTQ